MNSDSFDFDFRPATYWPDSGGIPDTSRIKGTHRRREAKQLLEEEGQLPTPDANPMFAESISDSDREYLGKVHPALMGGEYLPDMDEDSAEIVRHELDSTMADVISIRATRDGTRIRYSIVDEHGIDYELSPKTSKDTLTMRQVIRMIDGVRHGGGDIGDIGLTDVFRNYCLMNDGDPEELVDFVTISSPFYPELERYYRAQAQEWLEQARAARR